MICDWFENPQFMSAVIRAGIGKLMGDAIFPEDNLLGMLRYLMDGMPEEDGRTIARLVRDYNAEQAAT